MSTSNPRPQKSSPAGARQPSAVGYATASSAAPPAFSPAQYALGLVLLAVAVTLSVVLVLDHFGAMAMPGCGEGSPCAQAAASKWGKIPLGDRVWPVSFLGLAYFSGLLIAWSLSKDGVPALFKWLVRLGVAVSLFFIIILFKEGHLCQYCLGVHAANIAFWLILETSRRAAAPRLAPLAAVAGVFLAASGVLFAVERDRSAEFTADQEKQMAESVDQVIEQNRIKAEQLARAAAGNAQSGNADASAAHGQGGTNDNKAGQEGTGNSAGDATQATNANSPDSDPQSDTTVTLGGIAIDVGDRPWQGGFTGRWRLGPEEAAVRIVMLTDYQCPDCKRIEGEVMEFVKATPTVSLSVKHFPMDKLCNQYMTASLHANACWAARAAEAAGILYGNEGFWKMHEWLFARGGAFTHPELTEGLLQLGFEPNEFIAVMTGPETEENVKADITQADWLGLHYTPMVFINGVELVGVFAPRFAVVNAAKKVLATNPTPMNADLDQPQPGVAKYVSDWKEQYPRKMPLDVNMFQIGPDAARTKITIWIDYQQDLSAELDGIIRNWMKDKEGVHYTVRHYPFNQECNPVAPKTVFQNGCLAARAVEAAGMLAGRDMYWKMHEWLLANQKTLSEDTLRAAAQQMGLDADALFAQMNSPEVANAIRQDAQAGKAMLYRGTPTVYVNDKVVPRWKKTGAPVLEMILNEACKR